MDNDRAFAVYAVSLVSCVGALVAIAVSAGIASIPAPLTIVEHLGLAFLIRAAYKSIGGFNWCDWSVVSTDSLHEKAPAIKVAVKA